MGLLSSLQASAVARSGAAGFPDREPPRFGETLRRRSLVGTALAEVMKRLAIPSDWVGCNTLEAMSRTGRPRTYVQVVVHKGDDQLVPMVHDLQQQLQLEMEKQDRDTPYWLGAITWVFRGARDARFMRMPPPGYWAAGSTADPPPRPE